MALTVPSVSTKETWRTLEKAEEAGEFFPAWLACLMSLLDDGERAVLIWADEPNVGPFRPVAESPRDATYPPDLALLCERALEIRLPVTQATPRHALAYPILAGSDLLGVIGVTLTGRVTDQLTRALQWGVGWLLERAAREVSVESGGDAHSRLLLTLDLITRILDAQSSRDAAQTVVTELAHRLGCERVSLGLGDRVGVTLYALSHSADFSARIELTSAIEAAMNEGVDQGAVICLGGMTPTDGLLMTREHQRLQREYDALALLSVPFKAGDSQGCLLFEWATQPDSDEPFRTAESLSAIVGQALFDRYRLDLPWHKRAQIWLGKQWKKLIGPREGGRKLMVTAALLMMAALIFAQGEFRVAAPAKLEGGIRRVIGAPFDGFVGESYHRAGQIVEEGAVLATLDDRDLQLESTRWNSQQTQYTQQAQDAQAQHNLAQLQIALAQTRQAAAQRQLSETMIERSQIRAPFKGVIVSGDLSQQLGAAVKKGQVLYEIAPLDFYRIILEVEEQDIPYVSVGQRGQLIVAAMPDRLFPFAVSLITPVSVAKEGRNYFRVEATLDEHSDKLRPGMEGVAKVETGNRALVWIWTHRFINWTRLQLWVWFGI